MLLLGGDPGRIKLPQTGQIVEDDERRAANAAAVRLISPQVGAQACFEDDLMRTQLDKCGKAWGSWCLFTPSPWQPSCNPHFLRTWIANLRGVDHTTAAMVDICDDDKTVSCVTLVARPAAAACRAV